MNKNSFFITGTDTGVGKTVVSAIVAKKYNAHYYKPIQCGLNKNGFKDSDVVLNIFKDISVIKETYFFKNPLSPNIAAKKENVKIEISKFVKIDKINYPIVIEGAGGLQVPVDDKILMSDFYSQFFEFWKDIKNIQISIQFLTGVHSRTHYLNRHASLCQNFCHSKRQRDTSFI